MGAARSPTGASPAVLAGKSHAAQTPGGPERVVLGRRKRGQQRVRVCLDERGQLVASSGLESREEPVVSQTMQAAVCATFAVVTWWLYEFLEGAGHLLPACRCWGQSWVGNAFQSIYKVRVTTGYYGRTLG